MVKKLRTPDVETSNFVDFANMPSMEELLTGVTAAKKEFVPGTILEGKITNITSPKRLKRAASFTFVPQTY